MTNILPIKILGSEWSFSQFRIPGEIKAICNFGPDNTINVITFDGKFYVGQFDMNKQSECVKKETHSIIM
jgi:hypothetical protein